MAENFFGITDTGKLRDNNEDAFLAERLPTGWILACVIDGVGGYEGGEVAAEIASKTLVQALQKPSGDVLQILRSAVAQANQNIYHEKQSGRGNSQMACVLTLALVDVAGNQFYYAHVGDTRLYLLRDRSLVKVTKDHSFVGFLEDSGRLSEREAMTHPKRNEINKALGFDGQIELKDDYIETGQSPFLPDDVLMLCSDGLTDLVPNQTMTDVLAGGGSLAQKGKALIDAANAAGGKDNITVVLVKNDKKPQKQRATKPVLVKKSAAPADSKTSAPAAANTARVAPAKPAKKNTALWTLFILTLLFAGLAAWFWKGKADAEARLPKPVAPVVKSAPEKKLTDAVGLVSQTLILSPDSFGNTLRLTDTLFIRQDSLHINGNGLVLQGDSAFNGPAFLVTANCRYLLLENLTFRNFNTAVVTRGRGFQFRNVVFQNCALPVLHDVTSRLPSDTVNGKLADSTFVQQRSLPK